MRYDNNIILYNDYTIENDKCNKNLISSSSIIVLQMREREIPQRNLR